MGCANDRRGNLDPGLQYLRAAYAEIIAAFSEELSKRPAKNGGKKRGVKY
jgi:hypothetical protein